MRIGSRRRPVFATVISLLLVIFGIRCLDRLSIREYPDIERPVVSITTNYRGAPRAVIENKITQVIEDRIAGIEGIEQDRIRQRRRALAGHHRVLREPRRRQRRERRARSRSRVSTRCLTEADPPRDHQGRRGRRPV